MSPHFTHAVSIEERHTMTVGPREKLLLAAYVLCFGLLWLSVPVQAATDAVDLFRQRRVLNTGQAFLEEGKRELERGGYVRAIRVLSNAIAKGADPEALKLRGQAYEFLGESAKALSDYSSYIGARNADPDGYLLRGDAYNADNNYEKALADFTRAIELDPSSEDAYLGSGIAYLGLEQYELATKEFRNLLQHDPGNMDALTNLGLAYMLSGRQDEAKECFQRVLNEEKDSKWRARLASWMRGPTGIEEAPVIAERPGPSGGDSKEAASRDEEHLDSRSIRALIHSRRAAAASGASPGGLSGTWEGQYMGSKLSLQFQQSGRAVNGTIRVQPAAGPENTLKFAGTFENGRVVASHASGCTFTGTLTDDRRIVGVLTTPDGARIQVDVPESR
jgi:tetratricopeptide (TPR) repeat protein